ncbi:MAG: tRNA adenosine(34) deaminase TadA [Rhodoferax sp.]|uniref:tRNA adenosine(34) deaminase TadA n=1 Tax=Rhodoferax sp. TaxID=50421 RepID=UPI0026257879|nr:tRNA adenosine(34) deaminase TadA [Rhodoferax sp.]MDD2879184.1 tRNA adenosine(34) deaminase TadA [Rhodoferax sp.]
MSSSDAATDAQWMRIALKAAQTARDAGEVPVGAVVVHRGQIIGAGHNAPIHTHDPSAHAEMAALRAAALHLGNYRLDDCELFVTLEPCAMCAGAMLHARLKRVVFGASDLKTGAAGSVIDLFANPQLNHHTQVQGGVLAPACSELLQDFFRQQRQQKSINASPLREDALRTPASRFEALTTLPGVAHHISDLPALNGLRLHYVDAGAVNAIQVTLCLHGPRSWSQVWQPFMVERVVQGERVLALDLIGFGKSDKPKKKAMHTLAWHAQVVLQWMERLNLINVVVLELVGDALCDDAINQHAAAEAQHGLPHQTLGQLVMALAQQRVVRCDTRQLPPLKADALNAPYPDDGHRAAQRAWVQNPRAKRTTSSFSGQNT